MRIINIFDAVRDGTYEQFLSFYSGNINIISETLEMNLLGLALVNDKLPDQKIKIIEFLLDKGIDINYVDKKNKRNALHQFYFSVMRPTPEYMLKVTKILISHGINVNCLDKYDAIPLKYAITVVKNSTQDIKLVYKYLIENGSNYNIKDKFGKSCLDYANEYVWRNDFIEIVEEFENAN